MLAGSIKEVEGYEWKGCMRVETLMYGWDGWIAVALLSPVIFLTT